MLGGGRKIVSNKVFIVKLVIEFGGLGIKHFVQNTHTVCLFHALLGISGDIHILNADSKYRLGNVKLAYASLFIYLSLFVPILVDSYDRLLWRVLKHLVANRHNLVHAYVSANAERHVVEIVEGVVAHIQIFRGDLGY